MNREEDGMSGKRGWKAWKGDEAGKERESTGRRKRERRIGNQQSGQCCNA